MNPATHFVIMPIVFSMTEGSAMAAAVAGVAVTAAAEEAEAGAVGHPPNLQHVSPIGVL